MEAELQGRCANDDVRKDRELAEESNTRASAEPKKASVAFAEIRI